VAFWQLYSAQNRAPGPTGGAHGAPPDSLAGLRDPNSTARGSGRERERERERKKGGKGKEGNGGDPLSQIPGSAPDVADCTG